MRPLVNQTPNNKDEAFDFEDKVGPYMIPLNRYCQSLGKTKWDGEDLMQETLTKAYKSWRKNEVRAQSGKKINRNFSNMLLEDISDMLP